MSIALAVLADRLQRAVPQRDGAPADYEQLCIDAVAQLGLDVPVIAAAAIQVTAGVAAYDLPVDFLYLIDMAAGAPVQGSIMVSDAGLVPLAGGWAEAYYIEGSSLRFDPVPAYSARRTLRYAAGYALAGGFYARLSENGARIALLYAQHLALGEQANAVAGDGWSYKIGDESVDKRGLAATIQAQADAALKAYETALKPLKGYGLHYRANQFAGAEV